MGQDNTVWVVYQSPDPTQPKPNKSAVNPTHCQPC